MANGIERGEGPRVALLLAVAALLAVHLWAGLAFIRNSAPTYDEGVHLASGYSYLKTGKYRLNILDHPPFAEMWAAAALLPRSPNMFLQHPDFVERRVYHYADLFLYKNLAGADALLGAARRFNFLTWTLLCAAIALWWAHREGGAAAAIGAAVAYAFCPALLSNLALVTTDGASTVLFFGACALAGAASERRARGAPDLALWIACGVAAGLAMASKFNMVVLPPLILALSFAATWGDPRRRGIEEACWVALGSAVVLLAVYRIGQADLWWDGLRATFSRLQNGRPSFFLGRHSITGAVAYFPAALAMKSPIAVLLLGAVGLVRVARSPWRRSIWLWIPPAAYFGLALAAKVQIGYRHVLPVVPFMLVWAGLGAAELWGKRLAGSAVGAALAVWLAVSVLRVHPRYLAYFNEAVGGPEHGYRHLVDSNLDWGQGLKDLAAELQRRGNPPVYLSYFGTADPEAYGIRYTPIGFISNLERAGNERDPASSGRVLLAISATNLQGTYYEDHAAFAWLHERKPEAVAGHSIFLYDLTSDMDGRARLASMIPPEARGAIVPRTAKK